MLIIIAFTIADNNTDFILGKGHWIEFFSNSKLQWRNVCVGGDFIIRILYSIDLEIFLIKHALTGFVDLVPILR